MPNAFLISHPLDHLKTQTHAAVREPIERQGAAIEGDALAEIVRVTEGYPYFLQEWGSHSWLRAVHSPVTVTDVRTATRDAITALDRGFFHVRFDRLTPAEENHLRAMAELGRGPHRPGDIAAKLRRDVEQVAPTRGSIIAKGMAYAPAHGDTAFTVPMFDAYMRRVMPEFHPDLSGGAQRQASRNETTYRRPVGPRRSSASSSKSNTPPGPRVAFTPGPRWWRG